MRPLPNLPFLQTLDLSFNHISDFTIVQALTSFQHLHSLRVNDNPVQHEPDFYFSLQRLMPWTQHEFGHARFFPDDHQIRMIQQEAVLKSPEAVQAAMQGQWGIRDVPGQQAVFSPNLILTTAPARDGMEADMDSQGLGLNDGGWQGVAGGVQEGSIGAGGLSRHGLMMLEGAARRLQRGQVLKYPYPCKTNHLGLPFTVCHFSTHPRPQGQAYIHCVLLTYTAASSSLPREGQQRVLSALLLIVHLWMLI